MWVPLLYMGDIPLVSHGIWKLIPLAIWWCTWKERNRRIFEGKALSLQNFKLSFLGLLYSWSLVVNGSINLTFVDFIDKIMLQSLRTWYFCNCPFSVWVSPLWWFFLYISFDYLSKKNKIPNSLIPAPEPMGLRTFLAPPSKPVNNIFHLQHVFPKGVVFLNKPPKPLGLKNPVHMTERSNT